MRQADLPASRRRAPVIFGTLVIAVAFAVLSSLTWLIPDSAGYLAWGRSLLWDGDVDFSNEYAAYGMIEAESNIRFGATTASGRPGNPFGMGTALLWMPFLVAARLMASFAAAVGADVTTDGFGTGTLFAATLGTWAFVLLAWQFVAAGVRQVVPRQASPRLGVATAFLAMPLPYYTLQLTTYSHAASVLAVSLLLFFTLRWRKAPTPRRAAVVGLLLAVAALVRLQNLAFVMLPLCVWSGALRGQHRITMLALLVGVALSGCALQATAWSRIYASPFTLPQGDGFLALSWRSLLDVLLSTRHGLVTTSPIVVLAAWLLWRRRRRLGGPLVLGIVSCSALMWVINAVPVDWWAGWSFGARRFCNLIPLLAVVLAAAEGRVTRSLLGLLLAVNLVQWLRVATGHLSGVADPGLNGLWGNDFLAFLVKVPEACWQLATTRWEELTVLVRPGAAALQVRPDPPGFLWGLFLVWLVGILAAVVAVRRRLGLDTAPAGNSRRVERV